MLEWRRPTVKKPRPSWGWSAVWVLKNSSLPANSTCVPATHLITFNDFLKFFLYPTNGYSRHRSEITTVVTNKTKRFKGEQNLITIIIRSNNLLKTTNSQRQITVSVLMFRYVIVSARFVWRRCLGSQTAACSPLHSLFYFRMFR